MKIICNPLNLSYLFQSIKWFGKKPTNREAADPSLVVFNDKYYLFPSMSAGFWRSSDLYAWEYFPIRNIPIYDYAPDVRVIDNYLYFCASKRGKKCPILRTQAPESDEFEEISRPFDFWDPNLFQDDDGRTYLYWGCTNKEPIWGVEMDREKMTPIGEKCALIPGCPQEHGWERPGANNVPGTTDSEKKSKILAALLGSEPFIEGAWMTKHEGCYYLQYSAPGTELNTYADGVYVGKEPLGPFTYSPFNPVSMKPGGFITGAGHGSTFQDLFGNWWHISSMRISVNHMFERRLGLFPAGFDGDGVFFCNTNFADYPMVVPDGKVDPWNDLFAGWMLLSYKKKVSASSSLESHQPENTVDENIRTCWVAGSEHPGEFLTMDLGKIQAVNAIQINFSDYKVKSPNWSRKDYYGMPMMKRHIDTDTHLTRYTLEASNDGSSWLMLEDKRETQTDLPHDFLTYESPQKFRFLRITGYEMPYNARFALSGVRVFGKGDGPVPAAPAVIANKIDDLTAMISWTPIIDVDGYNVRYGPDPDKLYMSWMVYGGEQLRLGTLNKGVDYYVAVDAFNENGIAHGKSQKIQ